ncbi:hypothetical protein [Thalassolituus oleivorans]|uniref:DUF4393 domain-containing protein n=1 Tax=Thalassolituus oleivorans MIL-1 TaxID=1298593 RepID=M5DL22_9GAMM|nr:hypothetical protein [Thalassolituus oleivorans]CCU70455.1 hypothetical protein TOL_0006 [Thalassolituus oleivorans MIL-1]
MDKDRKREIAQSKNIPIWTKSSLLYGDSTITRALIAALPYIGGSLDLILSQKGEKFVQQRMEILISEINLRLNRVEKCTINPEDEEGVYDLFQSVCEKVIRTKSEDKIKHFARLFSDCVSGEKEWDETEAAARLISEFSDTHIIILKIFATAKQSETDGFMGLKVIPLFDNSVIKDVEPLIESLNYLSEAALKMYCSELVSRALLHDEGATRWGNHSLKILAPTPLADWLLAKIGESAQS